MHGTREMRRKQALQRGCDLDEQSKKTGAAAGQTGLHRRLPQVCVQGRGDPSCVRPGSSSGSCCHRRPGEQGVQGDRASRGSEPRRGTERTGGGGRPGWHRASGGRAGRPRVRAAAEQAVQGSEPQRGTERPGGKGHGGGQSVPGGWEGRRPGGHTAGLGVPSGREGQDGLPGRLVPGDPACISRRSPGRSRGWWDTPAW